MTGPRFNLTEAALQQAEVRLNDAADRVLDTITKLELTVVEFSGKGDAFMAAKKVANDLRQQAEKFQEYTVRLSESVGRSRKAYMANNEAGAQSISQIVNQLPTGSTFSRLSGGA